MAHIGIIGSGNYGTFIQSALTGLDAEVSVIPGERAVYILENHPCTHVVIATPNHTHFSIALEALKAGKHVLCEKPLTLKMRECRRLYETAKDKGLALGVEFVLPNHAFYRAIKDLQIEFGRIESMRVINNATEGTLQPEWYWNKEQSGGWFMISEIHWYHLFAWLTATAELDVHEAAEEISNGRTQATTSSVYTGKGQHLAVTHRLDGDYDTAWCKVEISFVKEKVMIDDWVPDAMDVFHFPGKFRLPPYVEQVGKKFTDTRHRDERYKQMVRDNVEKLLNGQTDDSLPIMVAHQAALDAQALSDKNRNELA